MKSETTDSCLKTICKTLRGIKAKRISIHTFGRAELTTSRAKRVVTLEVKFTRIN
jgi:hypothetical protein